MMARKWASIGPRLPSRRKHIPKAVREAIRSRAEDRCEECGRPLAKEVVLRQPKILADEVLVRLLPYSCWRCSAPMKVVHAEWGYRGTDLGVILEVTDPELGAVLESRFPWFKLSFSKTVGYSYYGNRCPKCDALQGHFSVTEMAIPQASERIEAEELRLPWKVVELEPAYEETRVRRWGHLHHVNGDPGDNRPENVQLLCIQCHRAEHSG